MPYALHIPVLCMLAVCVTLAAGCAGHRSSAESAAIGQSVCVPDQKVQLGSGKVVFDLYLPDSPEPAPLVVVAHGFTRGKANMAGWGQCLAQEGFVAVVPTLPSWSDQRRNARSINELIDWFRDTSPHAARVRGERVGVMGFSAGGLSSLLAAADNPSIVVWIGLDPVDRDGLGAAAAARLKCHAVILRAEPSPWNAHGNASAIEEAMQGRCQSILIAGAVHVDAEWPTDWAAELVCGRSDEQKRAEFVRQAVAALKSNLLATTTIRAMAFWQGPAHPRT